VFPSRQSPPSVRNPPPHGKCPDALLAAAHAALKRGDVPKACDVAVTPRRPSSRPGRATSKACRGPDGLSERTGGRLSDRVVGHDRGRHRCPIELREDTIDSASLTPTNPSATQNANCPAPLPRMNSRCARRPIPLSAVRRRTQRASRCKPTRSLTSIRPRARRRTPCSSPARRIRFVVGRVVPASWAMSSCVSGISTGTSPP
jgi:hypothetical protein